MYDEMLELIAPDSDWYGDDATLTCPDGCCIEPDAPACSCGHANPIFAAGMI